MALIRVNGGGSAAAGKLLEVKAFSLQANSNSEGTTTVTLDDTYANGRYALETDTQHGTSFMAFILSVSGNVVTIKGKNNYSSTLTLTGNVVVFED